MIYDMAPRMFPIRSFMETFAILSDEGLMKDLRKGIQQAKDGNLIPLDVLEEEL